MLLDEAHVLTCAHVVVGAGGRDVPLRIRSVACTPEWSRTARVVPGTWVVQEGVLPRNRVPPGDVTLLELQEPVACAERVSLWRVPLSGGHVRAYGFKGSARDGMWALAELTGSGGYRGELGQLIRPLGRAQWIVPGYSGAGVVAQGDEFAECLIGIVVANHRDDDVEGAWMLPTETITGYLPRLEAYAAGSRTNAFDPADSPADGEVLGDPLRLALTQELTRLLQSGWTGTVVVGTGTRTSAGASWLVRLVRTADPTARATASNDAGTDAHAHAHAHATVREDTALAPGTIDAAYDAAGKSLADVRTYLTERFGLAADGDLAMQLARRRPPPCIVVGGVDRAVDSAVLVQDLLGPLARRARSRGLRLVLGFAGRPPEQLPYDVFLDPEPLPLPTAGPGIASAEQALQALDALCAAEDEALRQHLEWGVKFFAAPRLPAPAAPRVRVRLAFARQTGPNTELAAACAFAERARKAAEGYVRTSLRMTEAWRDLVRTLELHRVRAADRFGAEDPSLGALHGPAAEALRHEPVDLAAARRAVEDYVREVDRRIAEDAREEERQDPHDRPPEPNQWEENA
ncbi:hypothetical protein QFZ74_005934 [Streptomyces sp. V3I7]|nr:hypothetical protein [Streptomyces sp. V3I7]